MELNLVVVALGGLMCILRRGRDLGGVACLGGLARLFSIPGNLNFSLLGIAFLGLFTHFCTLLSCPLTLTHAFRLSLHTIF